MTGPLALRFGGTSRTGGHDLWVGPLAQTLWVFVVMFIWSGTLWSFVVGIGPRHVDLWTGPLAQAIGQLEWTM